MGPAGPTGGDGRGAGRRTLHAERVRLQPGMAELHRLLGRGAVEVAASGSTIELSDGRQMLDFGSYAVTLLGHRHPAVVQAVNDALVRMTTSTRLLANPITTELAERLVATFGGGARE